MLASNRTIVELKRASTGQNVTGPAASNRTIVELKQSPVLSSISRA